jgi:transposase
MGKRPTSRRYSEEFKRDAVALLRSSGRSITEVAKELGVTDTSLGNWAREQAKAGSEDDAKMVKEAAELRKRIRELEQEIDILKRFTAYWVKGSDR